MLKDLLSKSFDIYQNERVRKKGLNATTRVRIDILNGGNNRNKVITKNNQEKYNDIK